MRQLGSVDGFDDSVYFTINFGALSPGRAIRYAQTTIGAHNNNLTTPCCLVPRGCRVLSILIGK
jgi:hypothetical protein